jgi:hypothetical protein
MRRVAAVRGWSPLQCVDFYPDHLYIQPGMSWTLLFCYAFLQRNLLCMLVDFDVPHLRRYVGKPRSSHFVFVLPEVLEF